jgi:phosphoribosylanthranilate isomerase
MARVKICGIKTMEEVDIINKYRPDFVGFIFAESKRKVSVENAKSMCESIDKGIRKVGVFVNAGFKNALYTADYCGLDVVQLHGDESPELLIEFMRSPFEIWKVIRVKDISDIKEIKKFSADRVLLDTFSQKAYGGTGKTFDWELALEAKKYKSIILSGGLNNENVKKAVEMVKPYAVDASSSLEEEGFKTDTRVSEFIKAVRGKRN